MKITFDEAKELSLKKWKFLMENPDKSIEDAIREFPVIEYLHGKCGFCELSLRGHSPKCNLCPIGTKTTEPGSCIPEFEGWASGDAETKKECATKIYYKIKKSKEAKP